MSATASAAEPYLSVPQARDLFPAEIRPSEVTLYSWVRSGKIPHLRLGRRIYLRPSSIEQFIASGECPAEGQGANG